MRYIPCRKRSQFRTQRNSVKNSQSFGTQTPREWESNGVTNAISNTEVDRNIQMINQHISISGDNCCIVSSSYWNKPRNDLWLENVLSSKFIYDFINFVEYIEIFYGYNINFV